MSMTPDRDVEWIEFCRLSLDEFFSPTEAEIADSLFAGRPMEPGVKAVPLHEKCARAYFGDEEE